MAQTARTIFVIEDDESVRRALARLIRSAGLCAESFATAEQFLESPPQPAPGCLVLDVHLPGLSGLELLERLHGEGRCIPVVIITAYGDEAMRERARRAGAVAFLAKPFREEALLDAVRQAVR